MLPKQQFSRINLVEIKALIIRRIGRSKAESYFDQLKRLFSSKLSKHEFDKFCIRVIGKENLALHNQLIGSIVKNACLAKVPPVKAGKEGAGNVKIINGNQRIYLRSHQSDGFHSSPRRSRSLVNHDPRSQDQQSPLGLPKSLNEQSAAKAQEDQSPTELVSLGSRPPVEGASVEDGEEVEQIAGSPGVQSRTPVTAPFGISLNTGFARKDLCNGSVCNYNPETCHISGELPSTGTLKSRLEKKLQMEGLNISVNCASLLNLSLDVYLRRLIEPCLQLATSRRNNGSIDCLQARNSQHVPCPNVTLSGRRMALPNKPIFVSMLDIRAAVELNPKILGENWDVQLEKICMLAGEE